MTSTSFGMISAMVPHKRRLRQSPRPAQTSKAGCMTPEIILMILSYIRHPKEDVLPESPHVLETLRSIPLVCVAWHKPGNEVLYQRVMFTRKSSRSTKLLIRSIAGHESLAELIKVLCFPELRFRPCDYHRNERSNIRLRNFARLVALCPNLLFLKLPTNLQNALSPNPVPGVPLLSQQTEDLVGLHLTSHRVTEYFSESEINTNASFSFLPIHNSFSSLVYLTLANFTIRLNPFPDHSRLLFPYLPSLNGLSLISCLLDLRAATQIFNAVKGTLKNLEIFQSGYLPPLNDTIFRILGPTLQCLIIDEYVYGYHVALDGYAEVARKLPILRTLKLSAEKLSINELRQLPPMVETLKITALPLCSCAWCAKNERILNIANSTEDDLAVNDRGRELSVALARTLEWPKFEAKSLKTIVLMGRCCAWHESLDRLEKLCVERGIELVKDLQPGECQDVRTPIRRKVDAIRWRTTWPARQLRSSWNNFSDKFAW